MPPASARQLYLKFNLRWRPAFDNFVAGNNDVTLEALRFFCHDEAVASGFLIWGAAGTGKTHLLFAGHHFAEQRSETTLYLDAGTLDADDAEALADVSASKWVLLDNIEHLAGHAVLEQALMSCMDFSQARRCKLIVASRQPPARIDFVLPDLASRLQSLPQYPLRNLDEEHLKAMLQARARSGGFNIRDDVLQYFVTHLRKNAGTWMSLYSRMEEAALEQSRPLTVKLASEQSKT